MTEFEKSIKRNVTREHFFEILKKRYGDGNNIWDHAYGDTSSWLTWIRDSTDRFLMHRQVSKCFMDYDDIEWQKNPKPEFWEALPDLGNYLKRLTTDIVFAGLNMPGTGTPPDWPPFSNARHSKKIIKLFIDTAAEGAYFTDIIKPDKRLGKNDLANGRAVMKYVLQNQEILKEQLRLFKNELDCIKVNDEKPLLVPFGNGAAEILKKGFEYGYLEKNLFRDVIICPNIWHYDNYKGIYKYAEDTSRKLACYITIPCDKDNLEKKWTKNGIPF
jgi:hypothetical protein